ncbi:MAG: hypothetical protein ACR2NN_29765 [Bryobacteraceae bacterium]
METGTDEFFTDEFLETSCLAREDCIQELLRDARPGCLYCALGSLEDEED